MPQLNCFLYLVMPLPLNMFDDYCDTNKIIALDAFHHIIDNTVSKHFSLFTCVTMLHDTYIKTIY